MQIDELEKAIASAPAKGYGPKDIDKVMEAASNWLLVLKMPEGFRLIHDKQGWSYEKKLNGKRVCDFGYYTTPEATLKAAFGEN